eukprot:SM000055S18305  [mRNA]  locus=s55:677559:679460:- [translate_table: standard]
MRRGPAAAAAAAAASGEQPSASLAAAPPEPAAEHYGPRHWADDGFILHQGRLVRPEDLRAGELPRGGGRPRWRPAAPWAWSDYAVPPTSERADRLAQFKRRPPANQDLFPALAEDRVVIVLYVHNRPQYLRLTMDALSRVDGINETLLVVSHDGQYDEMDAIVRGIRFCQVKQIYAELSPHLFPGRFPAATPADCRTWMDKERRPNCTGNADSYNEFRKIHALALKHHWWWLMNTVWECLSEMRGFSGHILFVEEDHYLYPNAYRTVQALVVMKAVHCRECWAVNLAPSRPGFAGELDERRGAVAEKMGFMGYAFNRTMWEALAGRSDEFCRFDDANWDVTVWAMLMEPLGALSIRATRTSAVHIGACGLHGNSYGNMHSKCTAGDVPVPDVALEDHTLWLDVTGGLVTRWISKSQRTMFLGYGG